MVTWIKALALSLLAVVAPVKSLVMAALALIVFDTITGVMAARKRGERVTSAGFRRAVVKAMVYSTSLLIAHLVGHYLLEGAVPVVGLVGGALSLVEVTSISENIETVTGLNVFHALIDRLGSLNDRRHEP